MTTEKATNTDADKAVTTQPPATFLNTRPQTAEADGGRAVATADAEQRGTAWSDTWGCFAVDLFAGAGGLTLGLKQAGLLVSAAVEIDRDAAETYRRNHPEVNLIEADIRDVQPGDLTAHMPGRPLAVVAGSPCQGYSVAGKRDPGSPLNNLFTEVARIAEALQPRFVVIENVPGLRRVNGVGFTGRVCAALRCIGYTIDQPHLLKSEDFGVPQKRRRLVFMASHTSCRSNLTPPAPTHTPHSGSGGNNVSGNGGSQGLARTPTVREALQDLPQLGPGRVWEQGDHNGRTVYNASTMAHSPAVIDKISKIAPGKGPISYRRLRTSLARTLVAGHRALPVHPWLNRTISVREAARIQGFPDDFVFCGPRSNQPIQVANAVPVPMAKAIAKTLLTAAA